MVKWLNGIYISYINNSTNYMYKEVYIIKTLIYTHTSIQLLLLLLWSYAIMLLWFFKMLIAYIVLITRVYSLGNIKK